MYVGGYNQGRPSYGGNEAEIFIAAVSGGKEIFLMLSFYI